MTTRYKRGGLTWRQRRFVDEFLVDSNATQAAARAGYSKRTANEQGTRLLTKANIRAEIERGQQKARKRCEVTKDSIAAQLDDDRRLAFRKGHASAAVSATVAKAKLFGLMSDRVEHDAGPTLADLVLASMRPREDGQPK